MSDTEEVQLIQLGDGFYVRQEVDNIGWADMGDGILAVDALEEAGLESEIMRLLRETVPGKKVSTVLNTHTHYDHVALNDAFAQKEGAEVVNYRTRQIPAEGLTFSGAGRQCRFIPMPGVHTREDCLAWFPADSVLFVGDIFGWGLITSMRSGSPRVMLETKFVYDRVIEFDAEHVVPGHGPLCTTAELRRCREYHVWLLEAVYTGVANGKSTRDLIAEIPVPEDMRDWWRLVDWKHERNIRKLVKGAP
ncbi:MAG: MBL fold metallo-hydrolase [Lentisphaeria bacterium]